MLERIWYFVMCICDEDHFYGAKIYFGHLPSMRNLGLVPHSLRILNAILLWSWLCSMAAATIRPPMNNTFKSYKSMKTKSLEYFIGVMTENCGYNLCFTYMIMTERSYSIPLLSADKTQVHLKSPYPVRNPELAFFLSGSGDWFVFGAQEHLLSHAFPDTTNDPNGIRTHDPRLLMQGDSTVSRHSSQKV